MLSTKQSLSIELFRPSIAKQKACCKVGKNLAFYCLLKQVYQDKDQHMIDMQSFGALCDGTGTPPEVANIAYITIIDEKVDSKDTVLHVINELYTKYVCACGKSFLVLEGDAIRPMKSCRISNQNMVQTSTGFSLTLVTGTCS